MNHQRHPKKPRWEKPQNPLFPIQQKPLVFHHSHKALILIQLTSLVRNPKTRSSNNQRTPKEKLSLVPPSLVLPRRGLPSCSVLKNVTATSTVTMLVNCQNTPTNQKPIIRVWSVVNSHKLNKLLKNILIPTNPALQNRLHLLNQLKPKSPTKLLSLTKTPATTKPVKTQLAQLKQNLSHRT